MNEVCTDNRFDLIKKYKNALMNFDEVDLYDYDSPIKTLAEQISQESDDGVLKAVTRVGIDINKEELIKALQYDRNQYKKGFDDGVKVGVRNRDNQIVRCKDCKYRGIHDCPFPDGPDDWYCPKGEGNV